MTTLDKVNVGVLKHNELEYVCNQFIICLNAELEKVKYLGEEKQLAIDTFIASTIFETKLHTLLTEQRMQSLIDSVFSSSAITDFILCLTDQFAFFLESDDFENRHLVYNIANQLWQTGTSSEYTPERIRNSIATNHSFESTVLNLLNNKWIITYVMIYMFGKNSIKSKLE